MSFKAQEKYNGSAYILHLERVCQLIASGHLVTVEFNPNSDLPPEIAGRIMTRAGIHILDGGEIAIVNPNSDTSMFLNLSLANYKKLWRCWCGFPSDSHRRAMKWR